MATIQCRCGAVRIDFPTHAELFRHECCCHDCLSALWYATKRGGPAYPHDLCADCCWLPNDFHIVTGEDKLGAFLNYEAADTTRFYCTACWTVLFGDHPLYDKRVVLLFGIFLMLYVHPKLKAIDEQTEDEIVHLRGLREADGFAYQALDPCTQRQMFAFQLLGMVFPHYMERGIKMALVCAPAIGVKAGDPKRYQERFQFQQCLIFPPPKYIG